MYGGTNYGQIYGSSATPIISCRINSDPDVSKVYDAITVVGSLQPASVGLLIDDDSGNNYSMNSVTSFSNALEEGNFKAKLLRTSEGSNDRRMRGLSGKLSITLKQGSSTAATLTAILTKYRPSYKQV